MLEIRDLHVKFHNRTREAVSGVSLTIHDGEILGLVGESGSGKSVTAMSVAGLLPRRQCDYTGSVLLDEVDLLHMERADLRKIQGRCIGVVFQEPMSCMDPLMKIGDQVEEVLRLHTDLTPAQRREKALAALAAVELPDVEAVYEKYPHQLSGGMLQRVMIAMSLSCNPKILIADEPTTALDVTIQAQILKLMNELKHKYDTSIILITHNLGVVAQICDRVAVMYFGRIMETAPVKRLFEQPLHPYTRGLFLCIPKLDQDEDFLSTIPGMVPALTEKTQGCAFAPRCPRCTDRCRREEPELVEVEEGHFCRCWGVLEDKA